MYFYGAYTSYYIYDFYLYSNYENLILRSALKHHDLPSGWEGTGNNYIVHSNTIYYQHNTPFSMSKLNLTTAKYDYRVIPSASESFSYSYSPHQNMDFSADENGLWVMYATEASKGKIVIAKIDDKSFGIENEWSTAAYKQLAGNAFMACGVMYATRSVDLTTEEIFYAYDTRTNEEKHLGIHFSKFQEKYTNLHNNPTDQKLYMYNNGYYVSYNPLPAADAAAGWWRVRGMEASHSHQAAMAKRDYLVEAAKQIHMALDSEVNEDYEAAFSYYKNGVDLLLNGVQLDPNKERREAVKRKTTQYLKRAEEIFITHLQDNLGKGSSHLGGYSSLRFRPIRHLSSPVEDLDMCKVVGVTDKVLIVQSMVNKETFVVKSLVKSSWESRDKPTIIPQGVPYMVKLLRYYVSEDAVYLHLEHVKGGKLFSKLHKLRNEKAKEHPECITSGQPSIKLKTSYTSPTISTDYQHNSRGSTGVIPEKLSDESPDTDFPTSWDETQQRLESCGTHSYIEETGCLQNTRSAASFYTKLDRLTLNSSLKRTQANTRIHTPAPMKLRTTLLFLSPVLGSVKLSVSCQIPKTQAAMGLTECSAEFEVAWKAADPAHNSEHINPYAVTDCLLKSTPGQTPPRTNQTSCKNSSLTSSPAILHLPLHCQTQIRGRASWETNGSNQGSVLSGSSADTVSDLKQEHSSPTAEESNGMLVIKSTDRAVFSEHIDTSESSCHSSATLCHNIAEKQGTFLGETRSNDGVEEACEVLSHGEKVAPAKKRSFVSWFSTGPAEAPSHRNGEDVSVKSEGSGVQGEEDIIEVDGWCHTPRVPVETSRSADKAMHTCWGLSEAEVRVWGAQVLLALESLHQQGILCRDLNPRNVLLTSNGEFIITVRECMWRTYILLILTRRNVFTGKVCLTFFGQWSEVHTTYLSPCMLTEIGGVSRITEACDWWSLGALLFELLTGMPLWQLHPAGIHSHTQLLIPNHLSAAAASLLTELLQFDAGYRLGSGGGGVSDIKCHPFFSSVSWKALSC
ncbi:hypothetical protein F7725_007947 [Dissostichus mawsoni]|uniref:Ribosomal protein S6 kinase-like 1 n=1 Tax=Dissostichus mawsoni TaxID=36200 RepID=A0A7J5Y5S1_DISMA|nr:hypothetical protein F7725_007947 [Dissostichus mawsoni]